MQRQDFWSKFYRKFHFAFNNIGIDFHYCGDQITWIYPWKRYAKDHPFMSTTYACLFKSIKEYNDFEEDVKKDLWELSKKKTIKK